MSDNRRSFFVEGPTAEDLETMLLQMEKMEAQITVLARRLEASERRMERFAQFFRHMLELHDRNAARLHVLDGRDGKEAVEEILAGKPGRQLQHKQQRRRPGTKRSATSVAA